MITHANLHNYTSNSIAEYGGADTQRSGTYMHLPITFDASITAMFVSLLQGKRTVISTKATVEVFEDKNFMEFAPYDFIKLTPGHLHLLREVLPTQSPEGVARKIVVGGEALKPSDYQFLKDHNSEIEIVNEYGPTEATVGCTTYCLALSDENQPDQASIPIGKPMANMHIYILDQWQHPVPVGVVGEIYIAGHQIAKGYLGRPDLTQERFVVDPFDPARKMFMYKTGDLGKWLSDGNIIFMGREDNQVKVRGYRVELGEVEHTIQASNQVDQVAVVFHKGEGGGHKLVGYIVPKTDYEASTFQKYLKSRLPEYMIPSLLIEVGQLVLTANGKVDRKVLPQPQQLTSETRGYVAPRNPLEQQLAEIWQTLLEIDQVGVHDNFFELGGHSLLVTRVVSAIRRELSVELPIKALFQYNTVEDLSAYVRVAIQRAQTSEVEMDTIDL